ncbi:inner membrane protein [Escherichia coli]|nr:inner membrane protein [Escherichia coli]
MRMRQKVGVIVEAVREMLKNHPAIDQRQTLLVYFNQLLTLH